MTEPNTEGGPEARGNRALDRRRWKQVVLGEVKSHPFGYGVLAAFVVIGPVLIKMIFPEAPPAAVAIGGLVFGVYAALCAVPQKFM